MMSPKTRKLMYQYRIALLGARDPEGNRFIINKLKRKLRKMEEN